MSAAQTHVLKSIIGAQLPRRIRVVLAVVLATVAATVLSTIGSDAPRPLPSATPAAEAGDETDARATDVADDTSMTTLPVVTYEVFLARDPFKPVVPEDEPSAPATDASDPLVKPSDPGTSIPVVASDPEAPSCLGQEELVCDGQVVTLLDTATVGGEPIAIIKVNTTVYEVTVGEQFADAFVVVAIDPPSVIIGYGDESNVLYPGDSVLK